MFVLGTKFWTDGFMVVGLSARNESQETRDGVFIEMNLCMRVFFKQRVLIFRSYKNTHTIKKTLNFKIYFVSCLNCFLNFLFFIFYLFR